MITVERVHYYSDYDMSIPMHIERMADGKCSVNAVLCA